MYTAQPTAEAADTPALILGILGFAFSGSGLLGLILSANRLGKAKKCAAANGGVLTGKAKAGKILATIGLIFSIIMMVYWFVMIIIWIVALAGGAISSLID